MLVAKKGLRSLDSLPTYMTEIVRHSEGKKNVCPFKITKHPPIVFFYIITKARDERYDAVWANCKDLHCLQGMDCSFLTFFPGNRFVVIWAREGIVLSSSTCFLPLLLRVFACPCPVCGLVECFTQCPPTMPVTFISPGACFSAYKYKYIYILYIRSKRKNHTSVNTVYI